MKNLDTIVNTLFMLTGCTLILISCYESSTRQPSFESFISGALMVILARLGMLCDDDRR